MSRLQEVSPHAEIISADAARGVNVAAAVGLQNVLKSNLGPRGTIKMLVGGAGQMKLTKDGCVLLKEMQIQHPTARMIARTATAQDDVTGDGTTTTVLMCGELLKQAERLASEGLHPRVVVDGFDIGRHATIEFLNSTFQKKVVPSNNKNNNEKSNKNNNNNEQMTMMNNRELLSSVAFSSVNTKLDTDLASNMTRAIVTAIQCIGGVGNGSGSGRRNTSIDDVPQQQQDADDTKTEPLDLNRIEIMTMQRKLTSDTTFVNGIVLDHGGRHPDMPTALYNCHIMTCNVTFEYEKTEVASGFFYSNASEREALVESERQWLDERCKLVIDFKRRVCKDDESFVMINQKGIDPLSLDIFAKEGILCLRRAKRRNMERLTLACGGSPIHSVEDMSPDQLGHAGRVSEVTLGEDKFTFVEECKNPKSCTLLLQGPNAHSIDQIRDACRDGLRATKNAIEDMAVVPGGGAFELAASMYLRDTVVKATRGRAKLGVEAFAEALLIVPKTLAENSGFDVQECLLKLQDERRDTGMAIGLDCTTGEPMVPADEGVWDNVRVKRQCLYLSTVLANQLLLVDEVMRAGKQMGKGPPPDAGGM